LSLKVACEGNKLRRLGVKYALSDVLQDSHQGAFQRARMKPTAHSTIIHEPSDAAETTRIQRNRATLTHDIDRNAGAATNTARVDALCWAAQAIAI
jgi:hypothetical protein